jgi:hypothetical protein
MPPTTMEQIIIDCGGWEPLGFAILSPVANALAGAQSQLLG